MKILITMTLLIFSTSLFAFSGNSVTWQKIALEEKIHKRYVSSIAHLLKDGQFLIEVDAAVNEPSGPNFGNEQSKGIKVSDISLEDSRGDYIAFSKVGLEVPVVDKFMDEQKTQLTNLYRYNEAYDLFKNLEDIKVTVFLSDKIQPELQDMVKKIIQNIKISIGDLKPEVKFESISMEWTTPESNMKGLPESKTEEKEPKIWTKDWFEWASRWGNAVGFILGSLILGIIALSLFKQWKSFIEDHTAEAHNKEEAIQDENAEDSSSNMQSEEMMNNPAMTEEDEVASVKGYERFQQCLEQHPDETINIIRNLLNEESEISTLTLRGLAQMASAQEMEKLLQGLSDAQRDKWKGLLKEQLDSASLLSASKNIFQEVVKSFLVPSRIKDNDLLNLLMDLNVKNTIEFIQTHEAQAGILMNVLSPGLINRLMAEVNDATAEEWLMAGTTFSTKNLEQQVTSLKEALNQYLDANAPKPFLQRIAAMIPMSSPARERTLYRALAQSSNTAMVIEVARKSFPSELILKLPQPFLKEAIQSYPMHRRLEILFSQSSDVKTMLTNILAEPGSPARDMIEMEMENLQRDPAQTSIIESRAEAIWQDFVTTSRTMLNKNQAYDGITQKLIQEWSEKLKVHLQSIDGGKAA